MRERRWVTSSTLGSSLGKDQISGMTRENGGGGGGPYLAAGSSTSYTQRPVRPRVMQRPHGRFLSHYREKRLSRR